MGPVEVGPPLMDGEAWKENPYLLKLPLCLQGLPVSFALIPFQAGDLEGFLGVGPLGGLFQCLELKDVEN